MSILCILDFYGSSSSQDCLDVPIILLGEAREPLLWGRLGTVDLLVLTCLDQYMFTMNIVFYLCYKNNLTRRPSVLSLPLQLVFLGEAISSLSDTVAGKCSAWVGSFHTCKYKTKL